jgi:hypothetical protein
MERVDYEKLVIHELLTSYDSKELNITPWYQRRSVWTRPQKAYLINTLFEGKPMPTLYIRHSLDIETEKSIKEVVDGQQRIRSILEYRAGEFSARHPAHKTRVKYDKLSPKERGDFLMTSLSVGYLIGADDTDVIEIFGRLNSVAKTLNAEEKRCAKYSGEVKQFSLRVASKHVELWRSLGIFTANDISRMTEVEFVSELALNMKNGLSAHSARALDYFYRDSDEEFTEQNEFEERMEKVFSKIAEMSPSAIKDTIFSRIPPFFSLFVVLDSISADIERSRLEDSLYEIDRSFNSGIPITERSEEDADFYIACTSTTQGIKSREIRDAYLRSKLGIE